MLCVVHVSVTHIAINVLSAEAEQRQNLTYSVKSKHFMGIFIHRYDTRGREVVSDYQSLCRATWWIASPSAPGSCLSAGVNRLIDIMELSHGRKLGCVRGLCPAAQPACAAPSPPGLHWALLESPAQELVCPRGGRVLRIASSV